MRANVTINTPGYVSPFLDRPTQRYFRDVMRRYIGVLEAMLGGGVAHRQKNSGSRNTVSVEYGLDPAFAGVTVAAPAVSATVTLNGQAITAVQHRASCTVTCASVANADYVTVNGVKLTAKTSPSGNYEWARGGTDAADALALVNCINALSTLSNDANAAGIYGKIRAVRKASNGVVDIYAITEGTAGNAYTITSSSGVTLAITNDSSGSFANGAAAANNEWDHVGGNADTARSIVNNLGLSSTAILNKHVSAACRKGVVTCASVVALDSVTLDSVTLVAETAATDLSNGGARDTTAPNDRFSLANSDTNCAVSLCNAINSHPKLRERFYATNSSGAVSIYERPPEASTPPPLSSSNGTRLAVTATTNGCLADSAHVMIQAIRPGHAGNAVTIASSSGSTLAIDGSASRLAGGTSTTVTL